MMQITSSLKDRFCKDCNIPLRLYQDPYFMDRLVLYDNLYGTIDKWSLFVEGLEMFSCEQDYFEEYNRVKDCAINKIKNSDAYQRFNNDDFSKYEDETKSIRRNIPNSNIYKEPNDKRTFISIDMVHANFSSLREYDVKMFPTSCGYASNWAEFMLGISDNPHIVGSKYIRQVILGNCNPKRHINWENILMARILNHILSNTSLNIDPVSISNDEIVFDVTNHPNFNSDEFCKSLQINLTQERPVCKVERFTLHKIHGTKGFYKEIHSSFGIKCNNKIELKCLDNYMIPFVIRKLNGEEVTESDKVFYHEGLLAKFVEVPEIVL